jgi:hypothetical protein
VVYKCYEKIMKEQKSDTSTGGRVNELVYKGYEKIGIERGIDEG